jgi:hypothetical protein
MQAITRLISGLTSNHFAAKGGDIGPSFLKSYHAAKNAGFKAPNKIDAYMFSCYHTLRSGKSWDFFGLIGEKGMGTQDHAKYKNPQAQIDQLLAMLKQNDVLIHRIRLDVEPGNSQ